MRLLQGLLAIYFCGISVQAASLPQYIDGKPLPDSWARINLNETTTNWNTTRLTARDLSLDHHDLEKRAQITVCAALVGIVSGCLSAVNILSGWVASMAGTIKELSDEHSCKTISATYEDFSYIYHSTGKNCDTTAKRETIAGAIKNYLENIEDDVICGTQCLSLTHGGTWEGYLKLGPTSTFKKDAYCGDKLDFLYCAAGGEKDD